MTAREFLQRMREGKLRPDPVPTCRGCGGPAPPVDIDDETRLCAVCEREASNAIEQYPIRRFGR
jgi:hypothetical protein